MYIGRSNDAKRRLQEHKTPTPQQDIDRKVAGKFKQHKESELRIKYVPEQKQKSKEGAYIECMTKKNKYRPVLNKRGGDGCTSCAGGQKRKVQTKQNQAIRLIFFARTFGEKNKLTNFNNELLFTLNECSKTICDYDERYDDDERYSTEFLTPTKIPNPFFNVVCPQGIPRNKYSGRNVNVLD